MVTPAGKELLRSTINTVKFHNRILEENDMWRQFELEKGLTMMVSDDAIRKKGHHRCPYHEKIRKAKLEKRRSQSRKEKSGTSSSRPAFTEENLEKWDHSGFAELYPDAVVNTKWDNNNRETSSGSRKQLKEHKRKAETDSESSYTSSTSDSDEDVWEEFRNFRRNKLKSNSQKNYSPKDSDSESTLSRKKLKHKKKSHARHKSKRRVT